MYRLSSVTLASLSLAGVSVIAPAIASDTLGPITITGSAIEERLASSSTEPVSSVTFSNSQVEDAQAKNLIEILRSVSGITADLNGDGETIKIKLRGVENQRYMGEKPGVAIVVDGVPVFERTGKVNIDLDNIESIKVIKGGASFLYGEDALSGAVIITTKRGASHKGVKVEADAGSFGYQKGLVRAGFAKDDVSGHLQYSDRSQDGYYYMSETYSKTWSGNLKYALNERSDLSLGFEKSDRFRDREGSVTGITAATTDPQGFDGGRGYTRNFNVDLSRYNLTYSNDLDDKSNLMAVLYQYQDDTTFWSAPMRYTGTGVSTTDINDYSKLNDYHQLQRGVKTEYRTRFDQLALMGGLEFKRNVFDNYVSALKDYRTTPTGSTVTEGTVFSDDVTIETTKGLYGEAKVGLTDKTVATFNARKDLMGIDFQSDYLSSHETKDFNVDSYRAGLTHALNKDTSVFGAISTGFRAPTAEQLFRGQVGDTALVKQNPNLRPERATSFELGIKIQAAIAGWPSSLSASVFQVDRKDFILDSNGQYASGNTPEGGGSQYQNIGGARSRGLELEMRTQPHANWSFDAAYTLLDAYFTSYDNFYQSLGNSNGTYRATLAEAKAAAGGLSRNFTTVHFNNTGNEIPRTAPHNLNIRARYTPAPGWSITSELDYKATSWADEINQEKLPGRTVFNLMAQYQTKLTTWPGARLSAYARVENLFNKRYFLTARGTNDSNYDGVYNAEDMSIVVDPGRAWRLGLNLSF